MNRLLILVAVVLCLHMPDATAQVPKLINLQGRLTDANDAPVADGVYAIKFDIFDAVGPGGGCLWEETQNVSVHGGVFSVQLGSASQGVPDSAFNSDSRWLAITVGNDPEMIPRIRLASESYSYRVNSVEGARGGNIYGDVTLHSLFTADYITANELVFSKGAISSAGDLQCDSDLIVGKKARIGLNNSNPGAGTFIAGSFSTVSGDFSAVGGGSYDSAMGDYSVIGGGQFNKARGQFSVVSGGGSTLSLDSNSAIGDWSAVAGGRANRANGEGATVSGGEHNNARGQFSAVSGGGGATPVDSNSAIGDWSAVGGGAHNVASGSYATIAGGTANTVPSAGNAATVGGGNGNTASGVTSTVSGGVSNIANGFRSTVGGGQQDTASGSYATVPGGFGNCASGVGTFASGQHARAAHDGAFVWADGSGGNFASTGSNQFLIRAGGGVGINTAPDVPLQVKDLTGSGGMVRIGANAVATGVEKSMRFGDGNYVTIGEQSSMDDQMAINGRAGIALTTTTAGIGINTPPSATNPIQVLGGAYCDGANWVSVSSREYKTGVRSLDIDEYSEILKKLDHVDVVHFRYKQNPDREHIGLIAEDVPEEIASDGRKGIAPNDAIAFLMAALKAQQARIETLEKTLEQLRDRKDIR